MIDLERGIDGCPCRVVRVWPQVRVGVQRLGGRRVPEPRLDDLDALAVPDTGNQQCSDAVE